MGSSQQHGGTGGRLCWRKAAEPMWGQALCTTRKAQGPQMFYRGRQGDSAEQSLWRSWCHPPMGEPLERAAG